MSVVRGKNHNRLFHRTNKNWLIINESTKKSYLTSCCIGNNTLERNITNSIPERWEKCPLNPIVQKVIWKIEIALNVFWSWGIKILPKCLLNCISKIRDRIYKKFLIYRKYKLPQSCMYSSRVKTMWIKTRTFVFRHVISAGVPPCRLAVRRLKVHKPETIFFFIHFRLIITKFYLVKRLKF